MEEAPPPRPALHVQDKHIYEALIMERLTESRGEPECGEEREKLVMVVLCATVAVVGRREMWQHRTRAGAGVIGTVAAFATRPPPRCRYPLEPFRYFRTIARSHKEQSIKTEPAANDTSILHRICRDSEVGPRGATRRTGGRGRTVRRAAAAAVTVAAQSRGTQVFLSEELAVACAGARLEGQAGCRLVAAPHQSLPTGLARTITPYTITSHTKVAKSPTLFYALYASLTFYCSNVAYCRPRHATPLFRSTLCGPYAVN
ncbi:hypothetical protein J6590_080134 [Homalodisca vitripennis]|nr:hypothetical protein J6590_080134 [Homalodisca vitripennis]